MSTDGEESIIPQSPLIESGDLDPHGTRSGPSWRCCPRRSGSFSPYGDQPRFSRKTIVVALCFFLVAVVVLAIIIYAITREDPSTVQEAPALSSNGSTTMAVNGSVLTTAAPSFLISSASSSTDGLVKSFSITESTRPSAIGSTPGQATVKETPSAIDRSGFARMANDDDDDHDFGMDWGRGPLRATSRPPETTSEEMNGHLVVSDILRLLNEADTEDDNNAPLMSNLTQVMIRAMRSYHDAGSLEEDVKQELITTLVDSMQSQPNTTKNEFLSTIVSQMKHSLNQMNNEAPYAELLRSGQVQDENSKTEGIFSKPKLDELGPVISANDQDKISDVIHELMDYIQLDQLLQDRDLKPTASLGWLDELRMSLTNVQDQDGTRVIGNQTVNDLNQLWKQYLEVEKDAGYDKLLVGIRNTGFDPSLTMDNLTVAFMQKKSSLNDAARAVHLARDSGLVACDPGLQLACADGRGCFYKNEKCDRWVNCDDNSDEEHCSCLDYLDPNKHCDGYPDCPGGEDELGCGCKKGFFQCGIDDMMSKCIDQALRCDNYVDCANGNDEKNCFALSPSSMKPDTFASIYSQGIVHVLNENKWRMLVIEYAKTFDQEMQDDFIDQLAADVCRDLVTRVNEKPVVQKLEPGHLSDHTNALHLTVDLELRDANTTRPGGRFAFHQGSVHPDSYVLLVSCGSPVCGFRSSLAIAGSESNAQIDVTSPAPALDSNLQVRIVGGNQSSALNWPFVVGIFRNGKFICGGTIVAENWILTAAHCVSDTSKSYSYQVHAGLLRKDSLSPYHYIRNASHIFVHDQWNKTTYLNDIALVKVNAPFEFSHMVSMACLPDASLYSPNPFKRLPQPSEVCVATGWGATSEKGPLSSTLMEVNIPILDSCLEEFNDPNLQVCGGYMEGKKDSCQGDSGGPLFCRHPNRPGSWYLGGIISYGMGCARTSSPGVYTRVQSYDKWIGEVFSMDKSRAGLPGGSQANQTCPSGLTCDNGRCIQNAEVCDLFVSCFDGTDELSCTYSGGVKVLDKRKAMATVTTATTATASRTTTAVVIHQYPSSSAACPPNKFRCLKSEQCIPMESVCDKKMDCADQTDELRCSCRDYLLKERPFLVCNGQSDCPDSSDEIGCQFCSNSSMYYCQQSKVCVAQEKVCDAVKDCEFEEDERYCFSLFYGDTILLQSDGKPKVLDRGLLAVKNKGVWRTVCSDVWDKSISDQVCKFMGRKDSTFFNLVDKSLRPSLTSRPLAVRYAGARSLFRRHVIQKRDSSNCSFVDMGCSKTSDCGVVPLYRYLGENMPTFGQGVFPWTVNLYYNGRYICGATLIHPQWALTHSQCPKIMSANLQREYVSARMGGYRDGNYSSQQEQFRRIVNIVQIPGTLVLLATFNLPVVTNEYVNTLCLTSEPWLPKGTQCVMTGRLDGVLNHAVQTKVVDKCDNVKKKDYLICTQQSIPSYECLDNWAGALACPDAVGRYYALGLYYSKSGGCSLNEPVPSKFISLVTTAIRDGITKVVTTADEGKNPYNSRVDEQCSAADGLHRCPLGQCLNRTQICDGFPHCIDLSDESDRLCQQTVRPCEHVNSTHCKCQASELLCQNALCVSKSKFCDGNDDCGDGTDEPPNCSSDCALSLSTMYPAQICNGVVDCLGDDDIGQDESSSRCCSKYNAGSQPDAFRCVLGQLSGGAADGTLAVTDQCVNQEFVCDYDSSGSFSSCLNGADEADCLTLWNLTGNITMDPFGRSKTMPQGYLYFVSYGKSYLYCASKAIFTEDRLPDIGRALCAHENFSGFVSIKLTEATDRQRLGDGLITLDHDESSTYDTCLIVFLVCEL